MTTTEPRPLPEQSRERAARFDAELFEVAAKTGLSADVNRVWLEVADRWLAEAEAADPPQPCPYDWCEEGKLHRWGHQLHAPIPYACGRDERMDTRTVHEGVDLVAREVDPEYGGSENVSDPTPWVDVYNVELHDQQSASAFLRALLEAGETAWPGFADQFAAGK